MNQVEIVEKERLLRENEYYRARCKELEHQWERFQRLRHDLRNRYVLELEYLKTGQYQLLMEHYQKVLGDLAVGERTVHTGNIGIDAMLSYQTEKAKRAGILLETKAYIKGDIALPDIDMNVVFGNLLDNAIEATKKVSPANKKIAVVIKSDATALFLQINNYYVGECTKNEKGEYLTTKEKKERHGVGLKAVKAIVDKYQGIMQIIDQNKIFSVEIFLYMGRAEENAPL